MPRKDGKPPARQPSPHAGVGQAHWAPSRMVSIDPGDVHVGVAAWHRTLEAWECTLAVEMTPETAVEYLSRELLQGRVDLVVVEDFRLQPDKAMAQVGSDMPTAQLIGVIKYLVGGLANAKSRWPSQPVELILQQPTIKNPTDSIRRAKSHEFRAKLDGVTGDHATDAELHGLYHLWKTRQEEVIPNA